MANLRLSWLGTPIIENDAGVLHLETRKATALVAFVSCSSEAHSRESLAALFWSEFNQTRAQANLRRCIYSIHKVLGPGILLSHRETLVIDPNAGIWQDVSEFRLLLATVKAHQHTEIARCPDCLCNLEKITALYRGNFLEGFNLGDCPEFDNWQRMMEESFRLDLASSLMKLADVYSACGEWEKAIFRARQWVTLDRLDEVAQRALIQIYAQAGQRTAALRQYEECTRWLQVELGQSPEEETTALMQKIQAGEIGKHAGPGKSEVLEPAARITHEPLIKLKLFVPRLRTGLVSRPHLITKLAQGAHCPLTLISAPAGYGKTTLLSEWIDTLKKDRAPIPWTVCWLSLDAGDNDPIRFLTYLSAALESVRPEFGLKARSLLQSAQPALPTTPLSLLINDLQEFPQPVILVLDDYQLINNQTVHDGITFLLEHMPINLHLVIATRSDPPLPIARLRGRNLLNELRANDLRFTPLEAATFLQKAFNLSLSPEQIAILDNRTEGWIAGLQMAAISMQGRKDVAQFIDVFSGSHRFIMDYLTEEALNRQSAPTQAFLLRTSILERFNVSLASFVLDGKSNGEMDLSPYPQDFSQGECQKLLKELDLSNLFIVPLDDDRTWYRYHHLFADLLHTRLEQALPELIPILHIRASEWLEKNGWIEECITHSLAARDWGNVSRLIDLHFHTFLDNGQMATVLQWIEGLPQDVIYRYPKLCAGVAEVLAQAGMIDQIDPLLNRAEELLTAREDHAADIGAVPELELTRKETTLILSMVTILRGLKSVCSGDPDRAVAFTQKALKDFPEMELRELAVLFWVEGWANRSLGHLDRALMLFTQSAEYGIASGTNLHDIRTDLANATRLVGKLPQAIHLLTHSVQAAADLGIQNQGNLARDETFLSFIFLEQNQLDLALSHVTRAIAYTQWWPSHIIIAMAYAGLANILLARGDLDGSLRALQKADQERKNRLMTPFVHSIVDVLWVRIWLIRGEWALLDQWSSDLNTKLRTKVAQGKLIDEYLEMQLIMLVRVWLEKTKIDRNIERNTDCLYLLAQLENSSQTAGRVNSLVETLFLKESIHFTQGKTSEALTSLDKCLALAEMGGYMRIFIETGEPGRVLLNAYIQRSFPVYKEYALKILREFGSLHLAQNPLEKFLEPLTSRELEVLRLLAKGYSNRQMAEKLVLAEGTIKYHVHNLLGKLQVESRTQAIAKAKELSLI